MKNYKVNIELLLSTKFEQSGLNKNDVKEKVMKVIIDSINQSNVFKTLFKDELPILVIDIEEFNDKNN